MKSQSVSFPVHTLIISIAILLTIPAILFLGKGNLKNDVEFGPEKMETKGLNASIRLFNDWRTKYSKYSDEELISIYRYKRRNFEIQNRKSSAGELYNLLNLFFSAFTAIAFILLWRSIYKNLNSTIQFTSEGRRDMGMVWLSWAMIIWELGALIVFVNLHYPGIGGPYENKIFMGVRQIISSLNSAFWLLALPTIRFEEGRGIWRERWIFKFFSKPKNILVNALIVTLGTIGILFIPGIDGNTHGFLSKIPDLYLTIITLYIMGKYLLAAFRDRNFKLFQPLILFSLALVMVTHIARTGEPLLWKIEGYELTFGVIVGVWHFALSLIFFSLAFSFLGYLNREELKKLAIEMNHAVKGNLRALKKQFESTLENPGKDFKEIAFQLRDRLNHILMVHTHIHKHQSGFEIPLISYLSTLLKSIRDSQGSNSAQFQFNLDEVDKEALLSPKNIRDIGSVILELCLNSFQAYVNSSIEPSEYKIVVSLKLTSEGDFTIVVEDWAGGYDQDKIDLGKSWGLRYIHHVARGFSSKPVVNSILGRGTQTTLKISLKPYIYEGSIFSTNS